MRFSFANNNNDNTNSNGKVAFRKVGIKISNLTRLEEKKKPYQQKTLLDYMWFDLILLPGTTG